MTAHLHGFFRSSASWRVRIALALKGIDYRQTSYKLRAGEQRGPTFLQLNPQGLVPALEIDGAVLTQSLAIIEYLDETVADPPLCGTTPLERARIRAFAMAIACETHPLQNLRVLGRIATLAGSEQAGQDWAHAINHEGLAACAALLPERESPFCFGDVPTLADICLVPQLANARRFGVAIEWRRLAAIEASCLALPAFADTAPEHQPDFAWTARPGPKMSVIHRANRASKSAMITTRLTLLPLLALASASAAHAATIPPCGPINVIQAQPIADARTSPPAGCDRANASGWTIDGNVRIWRCALPEVEGKEPEDGAMTHAMFITRGNQLIHRGPDVPNLLAAAGLAIVRADLSGDGQPETVIAAHETESQGMGVNRWTLSVFAPDWTFLGSRTEVADWGPSAFVPRAHGERGCAVLLTEWREAEKADGSVSLYFTGIRADVGGEIPRFDSGPGFELAMRRYDRRFEAQRRRDIARSKGPARDPLAWLAPQIAASQAREAKD